MLYTRNNQDIQGLVLEDFPTTLFDVMSVRAGRAFTLSAGPSLVQLAELDAVSGRTTPGGLGIFGVQDQFSLRLLGREKPTFLSTQQANERGKEFGLRFNEDTTMATFEILRDRKIKERLRDSVIASGPGGVFTEGLGLFTELATTLVDPLNIAFAFVPIVGQARFATLVGRMGLTRARAIRGFAEGFIGTALLEPIVLSNASQSQADYTFHDALLNVTFGGVIGGGLHVTVGKLSSTLKSRRLATMAERVEATSQDVKGSLARLSVGAVVDDKMPNVRIVTDELPSFVDAKRPDRQSGIAVKLQNRLAEQVDIVEAGEVSSLRPDSRKASQIEAPIERFQDELDAATATPEQQRAVDANATKIAAGEADELPAVRVEADEAGNLKIIEGAEVAQALRDTGKLSMRITFGVDDISSGRAAKAITKLADDNITLTKREAIRGEKNVRVENPVGKLEAERRRLESPESDLFSKPKASPDEAGRQAAATKEVVQETADEAALEAQETLELAIRGLDDETLEALKLDKELNNIEDIRLANDAIEAARQKSEAIRLIASCLGEG